MRLTYRLFWIALFSMFSLLNLFANQLNYKDIRESIILPPKMDKVRSCTDPIPITSEDVNRRGKGFVIREPGCYILCEDIIFDAYGDKSTTAITIESSNVTLDLGGHRLSLWLPSPENNEKNLPSPILGIGANGVSSIAIINGSITDFTDAAIRIENSNNIVIDGLSILNTGLPSAYGGLQINDSSDILIDHVRALYNFGSGMYLHGVIKVTVKNSHFDDNVPGNVAPQYFTAGQVGSGAYIDSSTTTETDMVLVEDCSFNRNSGGSDGGGMEIGIYTLGIPVKNVTIVRSEFLDNFNNGIQGLFNDASGLVLLEVTNFLIEDVISSGQRHNGAPGPTLYVAGATGFSINASNNGIIENCQANDNVGGGFSSIGMRVRGCNNVLVKNSQASANINTSSGYAFGFSADNDTAVGSPFPVGTANVFDSCVAQNNSSATGLAGGFKITNLANSTIENCISQQNPIGILVSDSNTTPVTLNNIFKNNIVQSNTLFGILDTVSGSNNAYYLNTARSNGSNPLLTNYAGLPAGTPFETWSITTGFSPAPPNINPFANLNIVP